MSDSLGFTKVSVSYNCFVFLFCRIAALTKEFIMYFNFITMCVLCVCVCVCVCVLVCVSVRLSLSLAHSLARARSLSLSLNLYFLFSGREHSDGCFI